MRTRYLLVPAMLVALASTGMTQTVTKYVRYTLGSLSAVLLAACVGGS